MMFVEKAQFLTAAYCRICSALDSRVQALSFTSYEEQLQYLTKESSMRYRTDVGFVPNMKVPGYVLVKDELEHLLLEN
jgi:hypothetical protein